MKLNLQKTLRNPYVFSVVSKVIVVLVGFLFTVALSRYLGADIKGRVTYVTSITNITAIVFGFGMHQAYPWHRRQTKDDILPIFFRLAMLQLLLYTLLSVAVAVWFSNPKLIAIILLTPIMVYDRTVSYITMIEEPNRKNAVEMIVNIAELLLVVALWIFVPRSFLIGVCIIVFKDLALAIVYTLRWRKRVFGAKVSLRGWVPQLVRFGFFPMLALLMTTLNYRVDVIMLEGRVSDAQIGIYSVGVMLAEKLWLIPDAMKEVMVGKIVKGSGTEEVAFVTRVCNTICLAVALGLVCFGNPFIRLFFGKEYDGAYQVTLILLLGVFFLIYFKMLASYNIVIGKQFVNFVFLGISVVGNVIANLLLIPAYGIRGAGFASVISYGICSVLFLCYFCRTARVPFRTMLFAGVSDFKKMRRKLKGVSDSES
jgi:Membrane protein involved in the export of O-antigen and teichoic acid